MRTLVNLSFAAIVPACWLSGGCMVDPQFTVVHYELTPPSEGIDGRSVRVYLDETTVRDRKYLSCVEVWVDDTRVLVDLGFTVAGPQGLRLAAGGKVSDKTVFAREVAQTAGRGPFPRCHDDWLEYADDPRGWVRRHMEENLAKQKGGSVKNASRPSSK